jgi:hypothetical protein
MCFFMFPAAAALAVGAVGGVVCDIDVDDGEAGWFGSGVSILRGDSLGDGGDTDVGEKNTAPCFDFDSEL